MFHCPRIRKSPMIGSHSSINMYSSLINPKVVALLIFLCRLPGALTEVERHLQVSESAPLGHKIGYVSDQPPSSLDKSNYYVVFPESDSMAEKVLSVNEKTGEILLQGELDHEKENRLILLAIPTDGSKTIKVIIEIQDENDNAPVFPVNDINLDISEYARIDTEFVLPSAVDPDSEKYSIKKYFISGGNVNNVFRLATSRLNSAVYVDLIVNGQLDREYRDRYDLTIEVIDGGDPPKKGKLNVHIHILDANDNAPEFLQSRYSAYLLSNATVGTEVLTVKARDADAGENARISYRFSENQPNSQEINPFKINSKTGEITVANTQLPPENVYELIVIAADHGVPQALESTVFLTVNVQNPNAGAAKNDVSLVWLTEDGNPRISEALTVGYVLARVSVRGRSNDRLVLSGSDSLCLKQTDSPSVYLVLVCGPLDRESNPELDLNFILKDFNGQITLDHPVILELLDINDNAPKWNQSEYRLSFIYNSNDQQSVYRLLATDPDFGENARIQYSLEGTNKFSIDPETGLLISKEEIDCGIGKNINFDVVATDNGKPPLRSSAKVIIDITDFKTKSPTFDKSLYEITVKEDADVSTCLLQVLAHDSSCGDNGSKLRYSFKDSSHVFKLDPVSGKLCLQSSLDYEQVPRYQLTVFAHDAGGRTASTLINVLVEDVNDNSPVFDPPTYNITVYGDLPIGTALLTVQAIDHDVGHYGEVRYYVEGAEGLFHVDQNNGRVYSDKPLHSLSGQILDVKVWAKDSGGLTSSIPANIQVQVLDSDKNCPHFVKGLYEFTISEDILPGIIIGTVEAISPRELTYKIISENHGKFILDPKTGKLSVAKEQDADSLDVILLNIEARASDNCASFSQIKIRIHDTNDNAPEFDMTEVETNVAEDFTIHEPFFAVQAIDKDKHENGKVTYELIKSEPACPVIIRPLTGQMLLAASLDYEKAKRYTLTIRAQDQGIPPRASFTTVYLNVLDVNDNAPEFENQLYDLEVPEDAHLMTPLIVVKATDKDSNENANIRYRFIDESVTDFGINSKTGEIFVRQNLDRETTPDYTFLVVAYDKGNPPLSSNASIHIRILDVNDNTPNCTTLDKMRISEDMEPKRVLGQLNAFDPDAGLNGSVVYRLQQLNEFVDVKRNGEVILKRKIRGALKSSFQLAVIAEDQGPKPRPAVCTLFIELDKTESTVKLSEPIERTIHLNINDTVGTEVLHINASNAHSWNIEENSISSYFDAKEGGIFLAQPIEESKFLKPHSLTVNIGDKEGRKLHVTFIIRLHHSSTADNETIVTKLQETTAIGTKILTLAASERSISDEYYSLVRGDPSFELVEGTGNVYLSKRLDYNIASAVQIEVSRNDMMSSSRRKDMTLIFELDDTNNHSPIFAMDNYTFNVLESTPVGALIGRVEAVDDDIGMNGAVKYRFIDAENTFDINVETGEIFLQKTLHHHVKPKYYMTVEAEDSCQQKSERRRKQTVVFINVVDTNDNPPIFLSSNDITIKWPEIFNLSNPIHYFVCSDVDDGSNGEIKYKIIGGNKNNEFAINSTTGALMLKKKISQTMKLTIRAMDVSSTPRFADQSFTIFVNHTSTEWKYFGENSYSFDLNPHVVTGTAIYNFRNEDDESVIFGLLPENLKGFEIGRTDGILRTSGEVIERTHRLIVYTISEEGNTTDYASVIVNIKEDSTSGPKIVQASCGNISIPENRAITDVMRIFPSREASTMDTPFFYHIEGGADSLFFINETSGIISCKELDREKKSEHFLIISVSDNHQPKRADVCTVRVLVRDENDNPPRFSPTTPQLIEITDSVVAPALILKLTAHDLDEGENGKVKFRIVDDPSGTLDIDPDTGDIIFARDYAFKGPEFILKVAIDDCSQTNPLSSERQIRVNWKRTTVGFLRGEPKFLQQKYIATVLEGQPRGTPVIKIDTSNKIFNDVLLTLNIVEGNVDAAFEIDDEGHIRTAEELDAEIQRVYILKIMATGRFIRSPETIVEIHVLDTNDNAPSFPPVRSRKIPENAPVGSHIFSITANDVDQNSVLEYTINPLNDYFYIGRFTGRIYLKKELDFETEQLINVGVQVFDGIHTAKVNFTVEVVDVNDNSPKFSSDMIKINVPISAIGNSIIGQITAIDEDQGSGGEVSYALLDGTKDFQINEKTGQLSLLNRLKKNSVYFVNVQATDNGNPQLSTIATIKLKAVQNAINDKPIFTKEVFNFLVDENHPPHLPFGAVEFQNKRSDECIPKILDEAFMDIFEISNDGQLSLKMPIDRESVKEFRFRIGLKYRDNGLTSSEEEQEFTSIIIQVVDFNDNAPVFGSDSPKVIRLEEKMKKGTIVGRLTATDIDAGDNARIRFRILSGNELGTIRVDQNSGAVIFDHWDDEFLYESPGTNTFNITFIAEDNGAPSLWSVYMAQLVYNIDNWSGSAPMFAVPSYHKYIPESLSIGSVVVKAQAHNKWDYVTKSWKYSISDNDEIFEINTHSGEVILRGQLDHERKSSYEFTVTVEDAHHRSAIVPVQVTVIGVDEFAPMFSKASYTFEIPPKAEIGQRIGQISATDDDIGPDGKVTYSIADEEHTPFIGIDPDSGVLVLKEPFPANRTVEQITVIASSGVAQHSRTIVSLELGTPDSLKNSPILELTKLNKLTVTVAVLFISLLLLLCLILVCIYFKAREQRKPQKQIYSVAKGNVAVMADINRSSPSFAKVPPSLSYERPKTFSLISSNSSDRNSNQLKPSSTHDGFGARSQPDSGIDPDAISINSSVTDYLLQIGITPVKLDHMTRFPRMSKSTTAPERIDPDFGELGDLIYAKVDEVLPTARMAMSSYHPTELSIDSFLPQSHNQPPQNKGLSYHPLTEVFTQISRMQEEQKSSQQ